ncbi:hypothetical protein TO66_18900 [Pseudomonas sp. MRSN 12121]|nr:hypothetical protein TO66_18900 [Pseudomonas sp. MRSN 12121]
MSHPLQFLFQRFKYLGNFVYLIRLTVNYGDYIATARLKLQMNDVENAFCAGLSILKQIEQSCLRPLH